MLEELAQHVMRTTLHRRTLVAIDGVDGSGKTTFASALAERCADRPASFDPGTDSTVSVDAVYAPENAVVLVEGLFLHRDELVYAWDLSIFLHVPFEEMVRRLSERDGTHPDIDHETTQRYVGGQRLYFQHARPRERATIVVDNSDPTNLRVVRDCS